jgi:hypothetical protein
MLKSGRSEITPLPVWSVKTGNYAVLTIENAAVVNVTVVELREP